LPANHRGARRLCAGGSSARGPWREDRASARTYARLTCDVRFLRSFHALARPARAATIGLPRGAGPSRRPFPADLSHGKRLPPRSLTDRLVDAAEEKIMYALCLIRYRKPLEE